MLSTSKEYLQSIVADTRDMPYRVTLNEDLVLDKSSIPKMSLNENIGDSEGVAIGTANSAIFTFTMKNVDTNYYDGMLVEPESGLVLPDGSTKYVPLGKFYVTEYTTSNDFKTVEFTCADGMYRMTDEYISKLTYPAHIRDVVHEIVAQSVVEFAEPNEWPEVYVRRKPERLTHREAIGHAAGCCGCNARFNRQGELEFTWYTDSGIVIPLEIQYLDGLTKTNRKPIQVNFEVVGQKELYEAFVVSDGNGGVTAIPGQSIAENETVDVSVNPFSGYELATISATTDHGKAITLYSASEGGYTFIQPDDNVTVTASFRRIGATVFDLTARAYDGGSIRVEQTQYLQGELPIIYIEQREGFEIDRIVTTPANIGLTKTSVNESGELVYTFLMPQSDVTINVYFKEAEIVMYRNFALRKTVQSNDVVISSDKVSAEARGDTVFITSDRIQVTENGTTLSINIGVTPQETDKVTLSYSNPMIYDKMVEPITSLIKGVSYTPSTVKYRGNPALQAGDMVIVPDKNDIYHLVLIISHTLNFGGGMNGEIRCPGKTEGTKSFSSVSPVTTHIREEVKKSSEELEKRLVSNNALVFNSMYSAIGKNESTIRSVVEKQTEQNAAIAKIEQTATDNSAKISLVVGQNGIVNENGAVQGSVVIEAINGESLAKIAAERIELEGKKLNIKVDATNIEGEITAKQINADGMIAKNVEFTSGSFTGDLSAKNIFLTDINFNVEDIYGGSVEKVPVSWHVERGGLNNASWGATATIPKPAPHDVTVSYIYKTSTGETSGGSEVIKQGGTTAYIGGTLTGLTEGKYWTPIYTSWVTFSDNASILSLNSGVKPTTSDAYTLGTANSRWADIYATTSTINTSDEREKNSIAEIPQKYSDMFDKLNPVIYKLNKGTSDRYHVGFIAQAVEQAMTECDIDSKEFAGLIKTPQPNGDSIYGLRYGEFIALAIGEIQRLKKKINDLEEKMNE